MFRAVCQISVEWYWHVVFVLFDFVLYVKLIVWNSDVDLVCIYFVLSVCLFVSCVSTRLTTIHTHVTHTHTFHTHFTHTHTHFTRTLYTHTHIHARITHIHTLCMNTHTTICTHTQKFFAQTLRTHIHFAHTFFTPAHTHTLNTYISTHLTHTHAYTCSLYEHIRTLITCNTFQIIQDTFTRTFHAYMVLSRKQADIHNIGTLH